MFNQLTNNTKHALLTLVPINSSHTVGVKLTGCWRHDGILLQDPSGLTVWPAEHAHHAHAGMHSKPHSKASHTATHNDPARVARLGCMAISVLPAPSKTQQQQVIFLLF
jgi:hypothetical protein